MELTHPITDKEQLNKMAVYLYNKKLNTVHLSSDIKMPDKRDYVMFEVGINLGMRVSDFTSQKVGFYRKACELGYIDFMPSKTIRYNKKVTLPISDSMLKLLNGYIKDRADDEYMFPSSKGGPLTRNHVYRIFTEAANAAGIKETIGCHGLRKTFGYWHYYYNKDIRMLMMIFNHSEEAVTLRYIGVTEEEKKESMKFMGLGIIDE